MLNNGRSGTADGERVAHDSVRLDEVLLDHHQRFGLRHHVAVAPRDLENAGHRGETLPQHLSDQHATCSALLVADAAVGPALHIQLVVPRSLWIGEIPTASRIEQYSNLVLRPVDRPGLQPHDEWDSDA